VPVPKSPKTVTTASRPREFSRTLVRDRELQEIQERMADAVQGLDKHVLLGGKLLEGIVLDGAADAESVQHGLGKVPRGWNLADKNAQVDVWCESKDEKQIVFRASGPVTISVYVYG
jgi:hypothetical protein